MRKLFSFNMITLDGFFEGPNGDIEWHNTDEEFNDFAIDQMGSVDTLLFGRKTYQLMASYWPTDVAVQSDPIVADLMNRLSKVVFSRTLESVDWNNTRLIRENAGQEIRNLKMQQGKDMAIFGSANLISTVMDGIDHNAMLVDRIHDQRNQVRAAKDGQILSWLHLHFPDLLFSVFTDQPGIVPIH